MSLRAVACFAFVLSVVSPLLGQEPSPESPAWKWIARGELKLHYRDTEPARFQLRFNFPPGTLPPGQEFGFAETVDPGRHAEVGNVSLMLEGSYGSRFAARAKLDGVDLHERNPTSDDRQFDADELWVRFGPKPEGLSVPDGSTLFIQAGKAPKIERQPVRMLESYGLASTAFNRLEDVQVLIGGTLGRSVYWRAQVSNGNPVFFRDPNALAGDNGTDELLRPEPSELGSGFPILYDADVEGYFFDTDHPEFGGGLGYRWQRDDSSGIDVLLFHYERELAETVELEGTFYGGDLDLLDALNVRLPFQGDQKRETGVRLYGEWGGFAVVGQYVRQTIAELDRGGSELEIGWEIPLTFGPLLGGESLVSSIQPAIRGSLMDNHFRGPREFPAPSVWWDWIKYDLGVRIGLARRFELTIERAMHEVESPVPLDMDETLVTFRARM